MTIRDLKDALHGLPDDTVVLALPLYREKDARYVAAFNFDVFVPSTSSATVVILQVSDYDRLVPAGGLEYEPREDRKERLQDEQEQAAYDLQEIAAKAAYANQA